MSLPDDQIAEVVAFDRDVRNDDMQRNGLKRPHRKTRRYNYVAALHRKAGRLADAIGCGDPDSTEVCIVNVAIRLADDFVPVVKEVAHLWPQSSIVEHFDLDYCGIAGWLTRWGRYDMKAPRRHDPRPFRRVKATDRKIFEFKHGEYGVNCTYFPTINEKALADTKYKYCQYSDDIPTRTGLMEWLVLYEKNPKIELLAKAGLHCFINPAGLRAMQDRRVFDWAIRHKDTLGRYDSPLPVSRVVWAARRNLELRDAARHFDLVYNLRYQLGCLFYRLRYPGQGREATRLHLDYERLSQCLCSWRIDCTEYERYIIAARDAGRDLRSEGVLYPPSKGGRQAFMQRLEAVEEEAAEAEARRDKIESAKIDKAIKSRVRELESFHNSALRSRTVAASGLKLVVAMSQTALLKEGRLMGNCIGNGSYGRRIANGEIVICLLKRGDKSFCDIEIDRRTWKVRQCYLKGNSTAPKDVREIADKIALSFKAEWKRLKKLATPRVSRRTA